MPFDGAVMYCPFTNLYYGSDLSLPLITVIHVTIWEQPYSLMLVMSQLLFLYLRDITYAGSELILLQTWGK